MTVIFLICTNAALTMCNVASAGIIISMPVDSPTPRACQLEAMNYAIDNSLATENNVVRIICNWRKVS